MAKNKPHNKVTKAKFKEHLPQSSCSYTQLAKLIGVHRYTLRTWLSKHPDMQELFDKQKQFMIGEAEDVIFEAVVTNRDSKTAQWYLKTMTDKYKDKKQEIELSGGLELNIKIDDNTEDDQDD